MAIDYEAVAAGLNQAIPFNGHVGLETVTVAPDHGVVRLPDEPQLHNHVGSQHAGALFTAGEAASGAAFVGAFVELMEASRRWPSRRRSPTARSQGERSRRRRASQRTATRSWPGWMRRGASASRSRSR